MPERFIDFIGFSDGY